ncbi:DUF5988 family protein [Micromonospora sp. WMMD882]|uniref:DUF5988 family protein n=1 Tax=Micromonospora sp. WMMD882 TaxID=3015151 RepID=UPI00248BA045|nr:DUF5988 family protein [Micromonospora sp. WMMD882]WBB81519.1 DUF5988 family protein [Micromonospora sp. WMMD882]
MDDADTVLRADAPNTVLRGGPGRAGRLAERLCRTDATQTTLKVRSGNCYDHFHAEPGQLVETDGRTLRVFTWSHRTYVAE